MILFPSNFDITFDFHIINLMRWSWLWKAYLGLWRLWAAYFFSRGVIIDINLWWQIGTHWSELIVLYWAIRFNNLRLILFTSLFFHCTVRPIVHFIALRYSRYRRYSWLSIRNTVTLPIYCIMVHVSVITSTVLLK